LIVQSTYDDYYIKALSFCQDIFRK
jgi:hypothetical protein